MNYDNTRMVQTKYLFVFLVLSLAMGSGCNYAGDEESILNGLEASSSVSFSSGDKLLVAVADTMQERSTGLMNIRHLDENKGMLFIFEEDTAVKFWMKNTFLALDMIFIDENNTIMHIEHDVPPCVEDPCPKYGPDDPYRYVVEANAGYAAEHGIEVGMGVELA